MAKMRGPLKPWSLAKAFLAELQRRRVFRVAGMYLVVAWLVIQVADSIFPALNLPPWTVTLVVVLMGLGFPVAVVFGWAFDITSEGLERTEDRPEPRKGDGGGPAPVPGHPPAATAVRSSEGSSRGALRKPPRQWPGREASRAAATAPGEPEHDGKPSPERVRRAFVSSLRHELRTPINAIVGYGEMILEEELPQEDRAVISRIRELGGEMLVRIDQLLRTDDAGEPSGEQELPPLLARLRSELRKPIEEVVGSAEALLRERADTALHSTGDLQRILDATRQLQRLTEDLERIPDASGAGFDPAGGRFGALSSLARQVLAKIRPVSPEDAVALQEGRLLVVDDNAINRDLLSRQLARNGYSVFTARDGVEALRVMEETEIDLLLLDLIMPELDGFEVLRRLKSKPGLQDVPVIMLTALDEIDSLVRCIQLGADDYLPKPIEPILLQTRIAANLEIRRMRAREAAFSGQLEAERAYAAQLLARLAVPPLAHHLRSGAPPGADFIGEATAVSADLEGVSRLAGRGSAEPFLEAIGECFSDFDRIASDLSIEARSITGSSFLAVAGAPESRPDHCIAAAELALRMLEATQRLAARFEEPFRLRVGIHTGTVIAGVLDAGRLSYETWGEAVETAACLKVFGAPGAIHVSPTTYGRLRERYRFGRGTVLEITGGLRMRAYRLEGRAAVAEVGA